MKRGRVDFRGTSHVKIKQVLIHIKFIYICCQEFYNRFLGEMKKAYSEEKIKNGVFGAMMQVMDLVRCS